MPIYDISQPISESLVVWPGDPPVRISQIAHLDRGDLMTISRLELGAHTGTHVDAPAHFVASGLPVNDISLDVLVGPAWVAHLPNAERITAEVLDNGNIPAGTERLLLRTHNSERWQQGQGPFFEDYVGVTADGAQWLLERGIRLVGIDYLSAAVYDDGVAVHQILLRAGVILVEGLSLGGIGPGCYRLVCLPLKLVGLEGAPARVILLDDQA